MAPKRPTLRGLSQAQRQIMEIVWDRGEVSAIEVREVCPRNGNWRRTPCAPYLTAWKRKVG